LGATNVERWSRRFSQKIVQNLVPEEKVIVAANLMNLGLLEHDYRVVQDFGNVHGMRLWGQLGEIFWTGVI
jgi:hypothetical protein